MTDEQSFKEKGNAAFQSGDYDKAISLYTEGIEHDPTNAVLFSNRSAAYLKEGLLDKAMRDAEMCIELDPKWHKVGFLHIRTSHFHPQFTFPYHLRLIY